MKFTVRIWRWGKFYAYQNYEPGVNRAELVEDLFERFVMDQPSIRYYLADESRYREGTAPCSIDSKY